MNKVFKSKTCIECIESEENCNQSSYKQKRGFGLVEALLSGALFALLLAIVVGSIVYGNDSSVTSGDRVRAINLAEEGLEAVRNIRNSGFANLTNGTWGLSTSTNIWSLSGSSNTVEIFNRSIQIGTVDINTKTVTSTVAWKSNAVRNSSVSINARITNWTSPIGGRGGMLVFGAGGTATDAIMFRNLLSDGSWSVASTTADVDTGSTNKALRSASIYSSLSRNEKIVISRHYNGSAQFIYAQVYDGVTGTWGGVVQLGTWTAATFLGVKNFSGVYLNNGDFMVVYSDNTTRPKFRTWNGLTWSGQISLPVIGGIPNYIVARARAGTNEVMVAFFDQSSDTNSTYFNGGAYATGSWTLHTEHSSTAPVNTKELVDFIWSPTNPLKGALVFANSATDTSLTLKMWTANGSGGGSWSGVVNSAASGRLGSMSISGRTGVAEFLACEKDANNDIYCFRASITPAWTTPTNNILTTTSQAGIQKSFGLAYETIYGGLGLVVYSDNTATPKYKKYNAITNTFDVSASSIAVAGGGVLATVELIPQWDGDDIMILMGDANNDLRSIIWDGSSDLMYGLPSGKALSLHGTSGSATTDSWYDFSWDTF